MRTPDLVGLGLQLHVERVLTGIGLCKIWKTIIFRPECYLPEIYSNILALVIKLKEGYRVVGDLKMTERTMNDTFWIGVYPGMTEDMIDYMAQIIKRAVQ